ncbi:unnamed protein product [Schistosoma margrebowiei]|uniref:Uncharacterized protein n=1 Tax=Schistosoma margrebowiei TaxID=48269 RepID=A0A183LRA6_9TREM|nr:unnamed protein product [Schistosoma margrebowiei]
MYETRKIDLMATEMKRYNLGIFGISKTHWKYAKQKKRDQGEALLYFGHEEENATHTHGFPRILSKARNTLIGWEYHGSRINKPSYKTKEGITMKAIQYYAPTNESDGDKSQFYTKPQSIIPNHPGKDFTTMMGDLNVKVETDDTG